MASATYARAGPSIGLFLILLGVGRFLVEFVRAKDGRFLGTFTIARLISAILMVLGAWLVLRRLQPRDAAGEAT